MSILKVDTINEKTSGNGVDLPDNNNITGFYNNATHAVSTGSFTYMTNWTKMNSTHFGFPNVGTQFSHSGGNFTTTKLGVYKVTLELHMNSSNNARWIDLRLLIRITSNVESILLPMAVRLLVVTYMIILELFLMIQPTIRLIELGILILLTLTIKFK